jgi:capsular exopolysaccharide synthesis family protein
VLGRARAQLLTQPREIAATIERFAEGGPTTVGMFAYAAGASQEWRLGASMNGIVRSLPPSLVDADMRRPSIASKLNLDLNTPGLPQLLASTANLNKCITFRDDLNLEILKTGEVPQDPLELLSPAVLSKLMNTLRKTYDRIIVDSPPMLPVSDAAVLSAHADSIVYVVKFDSTKTRQINAGLDRLHRHHGKRAGILLNKVNLRKAESYGDISYGDYYVQTESSSEKEHRVKHATAASL